MLFVRQPWVLLGVRSISSEVQAVSSSVKLHRSLLLLGVSQSADPEQVKAAYIRLVKVYHPDSGSPQADQQKFVQVKEAYVVCMSYLKNVEVSEQLYRALEQEMGAMEQTLGYQRRKLMAHRHYLEHDGASHQPLSQRQREVAQSRVHRAIDSIYDRQFQKALQQDSGSGAVTDDNTQQQNLSVMDKRLKKPLRKSSTMFQQIADEKIMEEMNTGGFESIKGKGAPISYEPATHVLDNLDEKLNKVLINSGCAPDWITSGKEIREDIERLKRDIKTAWLQHSNCDPGQRSSAQQQWQDDRESFSKRVTNINDQIRKFNFNVPFLNMQRMPLNCDSFMDRLIREAESSPPPPSTASVTEEKNFEKNHARRGYRDQEYGRDDSGRDQIQSDGSGLTLQAAFHWLSLLIQRLTTSRQN